MRKSSWGDKFLDRYPKAFASTVLVLAAINGYEAHRDVGHGATIRFCVDTVFAGAGLLLGLYILLNHIGW